MTEFDTKFSVDIAVQWFDIFLAALDCYVWIFGEKLLTPSEIFSGIIDNLFCLTKVQDR